MTREELLVERITCITKIALGEELNNMRGIEVDKDFNEAILQVLIKAAKIGMKFADEHPRWIRVEDELPKIGKEVLVLREDGEMQVAHQYNEEIARWWSVDGFPLKNNITHWMLLPQVPKKGD